MKAVFFACLVLAASAAFVPVEDFMATGNSAVSSELVNAQNKIASLEAEKAAMATQVQKMAAQLAAARSNELESFLDGKQTAGRQLAQMETFDEDYYGYYSTTEAATTEEPSTADKAKKAAQENPGMVVLIIIIVIVGVALLGTGAFRLVKGEWPNCYICNKMCPGSGGTDLQATGGHTAQQQT